MKRMGREGGEREEGKGGKEYPNASKIYILYILYNI